MRAYYSHILFAKLIQLKNLKKFNRIRRRINRYKMLFIAYIYSENAQKIYF